jgi:hypothetical protein
MLFADSIFDWSAANGSNSQYGLIHPQISLITHTCLICQANHGRRQGKKH